MIVAVRRHYGEDAAAIRAGVLGDTKAALVGDEPWVGHFPIAGEPESFATLPGIYRLVLDHFGLDRSDLLLQESLFEWVRRRSTRRSPATRRGRRIDHGDDGVRGGYAVTPRCAGRDSRVG